ncbi:hypothetical protein SISNIDRAFT_542715 [Sistotremastrum niveocremeum HHB9708]|uniref:F-box domain-containing protein n=1 Tax=Sistotremastrum niveocremeum HHB9708 TaxID=1314777 RepID=A0A164X745_9AGAM|nr:hypothetical protein SISNIDRAFT_542715 [Sistotremastrum niveocremeum HHB9708]
MNGDTIPHSTQHPNMEPKATLLTLPPEITSIILQDATLSDLVNVAQTCYRFYHEGKTSREFWMQATDIDAMALPTGHTLKTVPVDLLYSLAARSVSVSIALNVEGAKPKSALYYTHGVGITNARNVDIHTLPSDSWYIEHEMDRPSIRRAWPGWTHISCDLGPGIISHTIHAEVSGGGDLMLHMASTSRNYKDPLHWNWMLRALTIGFPDERKVAAAPVIKREQRVVLSDPFDGVSFQNPLLLVYALGAFGNRKASLRFLNVNTKCGVILRTPKPDFGLPPRSILKASLSERGRKIIILTRDIDFEVYPMNQIIYIAEFPLELSESDMVKSQDFDIQPSDVEWTERDLKITHSYIIPAWSPDTIPMLPAVLPKGAMKLYSLDHEFPQELSRDPEHFGSLYLCDDELLAFETHEALRETHILDVSKSQVSRCQHIRLRKAGDVEALAVLDTQTKKLANYRLEVPTNIPDLDEYEVFGLDSSRGRLWIRSKWDGSEAKYYTLQY